MLAKRARKCLGQRQKAKALHSSLTKTQNKVVDNDPQMIASDLFPMKCPDGNFPSSLCWNSPISPCDINRTDYLHHHNPSTHLLRMMDTTLFLHQNKSD